MPYCSSCGAEFSEGASFCSGCGNEVGESPTLKDQETESLTLEEKGGDSSANTAPCQKCSSQISKEADRCPECGHEPSSSGILSGLFSVVCIFWLGTGILLFVGAIVALFTGGYTVSGFLGMMLFTVLFCLIPAVNLYLDHKKSGMGPTDELEIGGEKIE